MAEAVVDLEAIAHNTRLLIGAAGGAELMAVVKANGFGHGATTVARTMLSHGASWLGVTSPAEASALRADGVDAPMLLWLYPPDQAFDELLTQRVDISVASATALQSVADAAGRVGVVANVHLKVDTGMSRGGAGPEQWPDLLAWSRKFEAAGLVLIRGVWSHLANADTEDLGDVNLAEQLRRFDVARRSAFDAGILPPFVHLANSAALLQLPRSRFDLVRPGIALYGVEPVPGKVFGLRPAMTVTARVLLVKRVPAGTGVSYGPDHVTDRETTLAQIPLGFADGLPRQAAGRASLLVHGVRCPIVGRITMDQVVVDVGDLPVRVGDPAVMFGPGTQGEPTAAEWAQWADTNPHDILTGIGSRLPRRYTPAAS